MPTPPVCQHLRKNGLFTAIMSTAIMSVVLSGVALTSALTSGCISYRVAKDSYDLNEVVRVAEQVLKERYYQTKAFSVLEGGGHVIAYSPVKMEGVNKVRYRIDVNVRYENTGHFMPRVYVRKYTDWSSPDLERGDFSSPYEVSGHPFAKADWHPLYYDRALEDELRTAILDRLASTDTDS